MAIITGTNAADNLSGTGAADTITALAGSDRANGGSADDVISGGDGADTLSGGAGDDILYGHGPSDTQAGSGDIKATLISSAFNRPVFATSAPGDPDRLFVIEAHSGQIRILDPATGTGNATPFLDIPDSQIRQGSEEGLLGLAFHPQYESNRQFFVFIVNAAGDLEVRRYLRSAADPHLADPASGDVILAIPHPGNSNHNGGWIGFGPDGFLYVSVGDGGGGGDPANNAQNTDVLLGKMLRIDVGGDAFPADPNRDYRIPAGNPFAGLAGADEIWALGLRNPWRPSFDRATGDLFIADVGQGEREEVNFQPAGGGGENYGWKVKEGNIVYDDTVPGNPPPATLPLTDPLIDYPHVAGAGGGYSVTGGYVYRGTAPGLQGVYLFADFVSDQLWTFRVVNGQPVDFANRTGQLKVQGGSVDAIASFAEDGRGNLYIIGLDGEVFRLEPQASGGDLADTISGGTGNDRIHGGIGDDRLNGEAGNDAVHGGPGNDAIGGGDEKDTLNGNDGDDAMLGGSGNDNLRGDAGNDRIAGGPGNDVLRGGAGFDTFIFNSVTEGNDRTDDWTGADDQLQIDASNFGGGLAAGALAANRLVVSAAPVVNQAFGQFLYNATTGQLSWDVDGTGVAAAVGITRLLNGGVAVGTLAMADFDIVA
jgi:Ca2+-binding RTX toxin-like protein